jgi:hypothetical protein
MANKFLNEKIFSFFFILGKALGIRNDNLLEMVNIVSIYVISVLYFADWDLNSAIFTEYSSDRPSRVSPYCTLWTY